MKFRVERDALADAVAWTAKSLPSRPSVPVLAGVLLRVSDGVLQVSGFDYEVSSQVTVEVQPDSDGAALVSGRHVRQRRVVLDRHGREGEPGAATGDLDV